MSLKKDFKRPITSFNFGEEEFSTTSMMNSGNSSDDVPRHKIECKEPRHLLVTQGSDQYRPKYEKVSNKYLYLKHDDSRRTFSGSKFCSRCEEYARKIKEMNAQISFKEEQILSTGQHLKQYDKLLLDKDIRLKEQERIVKIDQDLVNTEKKKIYDMSLELEEEKKRVAQETEILKIEKNNIDYQLKLLDQKNEEFQILIESYEQKKREFNSNTKNQNPGSLDQKESLLISREQEIKRLFQEANVFHGEVQDNSDKTFLNIAKIQKTLEEKDLKLKNKKKQLIEYEKSLKIYEEKIALEQEDHYQKLGYQEYLLKQKEEKLETEKKKIAEANFLLDKKISSIEKIEKKLKIKKKKFSELEITPSPLGKATNPNKNNPSIRQKQLKGTRASSQVYYELKDYKNEEDLENQLDRSDILESKDNIVDENTHEINNTEASEEIYALKTQISEAEEKIKEYQANFLRLNNKNPNFYGSEFNRMDLNEENASVRGRLYESNEKIKMLEKTCKELERELHSKVSKSSKLEAQVSVLGQELDLLNRSGLHAKSASIETHNFNAKTDPKADQELIKALKNQIQVLESQIKTLKKEIETLKQSKYEKTPEPQSLNLEIDVKTDQELINGLKNRIKDLESQLNTFKNQKTSYDKDNLINTLRNEIETLKKSKKGNERAPEPQILNLEIDVKTDQELINGLRNQIKALESQVNTLKKEIETLKKSKYEQAPEPQSLNLEIDVKTDQELINGLKNQIKALESQLNAFNNQKPSYGKDDLINTLRNEIEALKKSNAEYEKNAPVINIEVRPDNETIKSLKSSNKALNQQIQELEQKINALETQPSTNHHQNSDPNSLTIEIEVKTQEDIISALKSQIETLSNENKLLKQNKSPHVPDDNQILLEIEVKTDEDTIKALKKEIQDLKNTGNPYPIKKNPNQSPDLIETLDKSIKELNNQISKLKKNETNLKSKINELDHLMYSEGEKLKKELHMKTSKCAKLENIIQKFEEKISEADKKNFKALYSEEILINQCENCASLKSQIRLLESEISNKVSECQQCPGLKSQIFSLQCQVSSNPGELSTEMDSLIKSLNDKIQSLENDNVDALNKYAVAMMETEKYRKLSETLHDKLIEGDSSSESSDSREYSPEMIKSLQKELEAKLDQLRLKQEELDEIEENLKKEREAIEEGAQYIQTINEEFIKNQAKLNEEKEELRKETLRINNFHETNEEKSKMLSNMEQELLVLKEKLDVREKLLCAKEKKVYSQERP
jgi:chromosome segregation ATPase